MSNELKRPVSVYVAALADGDPARLDACLAEDVRVNDAGEGDVIAGREKVKAWFGETGERFKLAIEVTDVREEGGRTVVSMLTSGDFPGSPRLFVYHFSIRNDVIADIDITPA